VVVLFTCVGVPEYKSKAGGQPGEPSEIRMGSRLASTTTEL
jgi:hypothetical protein